jgi:murein L,D-transpeptidase YcbB/YkuD
MPLQLTFRGNVGIDTRMDCKILHQVARDFDPSVWYGVAPQRHTLPLPDLSQTSAQHNAFGQVPEIFPNPYDVYLQDMQGNSLLPSGMMTFSPGRTRIRDPRCLPGRMLDDMPAGDART